jgi:predicted nucleic acid-binding protein
MKFWDSSAVVPLCVIEPHSEVVEKILKNDERMVVWWGTHLECLSALSRRVREGSVSRYEAGSFEKSLTLLSSAWIEVHPKDSIRDRARRILPVHPLRAADALQLAAALVFSRESPFGIEFVSLDDRLRECAGKEGFTVLPL